MRTEIIDFLKKVFDEVTYKEGDGLIVTVKHKGKTKKFTYDAGTYEKPFSMYDEKACRVQARGMAVDVIDYLMEV